MEYANTYVILYFIFIFFQKLLLFQILLPLKE